MTSIRPAMPQDMSAIAQLHRQAFGGEAEAKLVERLCREGLVAASLIAEDEGQFAGHVLLSWLEMRASAPMPKAVALAPVAVLPAKQRTGIGSQLVNAAIPAAREAAAGLIFVLGDPEFYERFGFSSQKGAGFVNPFNSTAFMALETGAGCSASTGGEVVYPPAFGLRDLREQSQS